MSSFSLGIECQLTPDVLPDMEVTALDTRTIPIPGNGQQYAFLTIADYYNRRWKPLEEFIPVAT